MCARTAAHAVMAAVVAGFAGAAANRKIRGLLQQALVVLGSFSPLPQLPLLIQTADERHPHQQVQSSARRAGWCECWMHVSPQYQGLLCLKQPQYRRPLTPGTLTCSVTWSPHSLLRAMALQ